MKKLKKLYEFIKKIFIRNNQTKIEKAPSPFLSRFYVGDVIWAKRYKTFKQMISIPLGHREGPFIVVGKNNNSLICLNGTSKEQDDLSSYFKLKKENHCNYKDGYYRLYNLNEITEKEFIEKKDILSHDELEEIFVGLKKQKCKSVKLPIRVGDLVINKGVYYFVLDLSKEALVVPVDDKELDLNSINSIDFKKVKSISVEQLEFIEYIESNLVAYTLKKYKEYIDYNLIKKVPHRGSIISKYNSYYYIFGEEGQKWLAFKINKREIPDLQEIIIGDKKYYTNFVENKLSKTEKYNVVLSLDEKDIEKIKLARKSYMKTNKMKLQKENKRVQLSETNIMIGSVVKKKSTNEEYIVKQIIGKTICCINAFEHNSHDKKYYYFEINEIELPNKVKRK